MSQNNINPLSQYFRQPVIYITLPSNGKFYPPGTLDMPANRELPVLPMTAIDEITYRTPDALFNGQAVVNVIQSCVPAIKDAWAVPAMDVDTILIAIRVATYGHEMEFESTCPACAASAERGLDLRTVLEKIKAPDYDTPISYGDMQFFFRPMQYRDLNANNQLQFEEQKLFQMLPDPDIPDQEKVSSLSDALKKITQVTVRALAQSIAAVKTPQAMVTESAYIEELLINCDRALFAQLRDHIISIKTQAEMPDMSLVCDECQHSYKQSLTLDMSSFFAPAS
jgi:hypothetical protein